jgi:hypothetical protein
MPARNLHFSSDFVAVTLRTQSFGRWADYLAGWYVGAAVADCAAWNLPTWAQPILMVIYMMVHRRLQTK